MVLVVRTHEERERSLEQVGKVGFEREVEKLLRELRSKLLERSEIPVLAKIFVAALERILDDRGTGLQVLMVLLQKSLSIEVLVLIFEFGPGV